MKALTVALVQRGSGGRAVVKSRLEADVYILPENWVSGEPVTLEDYEHSLETLAGELGADVVLGGAQYVIDQDGELRSVGLAYIKGRLERVCEKLFPSAAVGERSLIRPGRMLEPVEYGGWKISCIVCVDIFYPEIARIHAIVYGASLIVNPSKIPVDRLHLWRSALLARAAENTVYVAGVNAAGERYRDGRSVEGGSAVYAPDGRPVVEAGWGTGVFAATLDPERIAAARRRWAFADDAEKLYKSLYIKALEVINGGRINPQAG